MKLASLLVLVFLFAVTPACESLGGGDGSTGLGAININQILSGITDEASAQEAKAPLDGAVAMLKQALAGAKDDAKKEVENASEAGGNMVADIAAQFGISAETTNMITGLLADPAVQGVLGQALGELQGLIAGM